MKRRAGSGGGTVLEHMRRQMAIKRMKEEARRLGLPPDETAGAPDLGTLSETLADRILSRARSRDSDDRKGMP